MGNNIIIRVIYLMKCLKNKLRKLREILKPQIKINDNDVNFKPLL